MSSEQFKRVLVVSTDSERLRDRLICSGDVSVHWEKDPGKTPASLQLWPFDLVVLIMDEDEAEKMAAKVREKRPQTPVLINPKPEEVFDTLG